MRESDLLSRQAYVYMDIEIRIYEYVCMVTHYKKNKHFCHIETKINHLQNK